MKILQVSHGFPPNEKAGVELYTFYLSKALVHLNHEVSIFCREEDPDKEEFSFRQEGIDGLKVTRVVNNLTRVSDSRAFYDNHFFDQPFMKVLKEEKPDLVHFQHFIALSANLLRIAKEEGYPLVFTLHDFFIFCHRIHLLKEDDRLCPGPRYGLECVSCLNSAPAPRDLRTRFFLRQKEHLPFPLIKWTKRFFIPSKYLGERGYEAFHRYRYMYEVLKGPDLLLIPSHFVRDLYLKYYPFIQPRTRVLPLGIPPVAGTNLRQRPAKRNSEAVRFCYFGNILPIKGLHILMEAFKTLPKDKATLTIYGSRNSWNEVYYDRLKQQASGFSVDFRGSFQRDHLAEALSDQDVVVLPSICYESFSFVIREANLLGLPVIASRIGAIPEAVEEGVNGFLFEPGNAEGLRRCMMQFIQEPRLIQQMAVSRPGVKSMEEHALELSDIYQRIAEKRR
ncbi:MAG TPA: glycosyltransferase family 4 protein [Thermodesulfobacteriota bacterium]|nr:glycosyltransferase family 4 protein [Thermodesulfobacteriota bacterium]